VRRGSWLINAAAYLPARNHGSTRTKHGRNSPSSSAHFRRPSPAPILAAAADLDCVAVTHAQSRGSYLYDP
jgi:hypothetical protein